MSQTPPDPAKARFFLLGAVRLSGVAFALLGVAVVTKHWVEPAEIVGGLLIVVGMFDVLVFPLVLARRWRTPRDL